MYLEYYSNRPSFRHHIFTPNFVNQFKKELDELVSSLVQQFTYYPILFGSFIAFQSFYCIVHLHLTQRLTGFPTNSSSSWRLFTYCIPLYFLPPPLCQYLGPGPDFHHFPQNKTSVFPLALFSRRFPS